MALQIGAGFVARSFSGDRGQLVPLIKAGLLHRGFAFIDVISPCVAFNNHNGSTKSYEYTRGHAASFVAADFVAPHEQITADYAPGEHEIVRLPDGSELHLRKLDEDYDPHDRGRALAHIQEASRDGEVVTGLLYVDSDGTDCHEILDTVDTPLSVLGEAELCPGQAALDGINAGFR